MASKMSGPGMLYVTSKIARKDLMDYDIYMNWCETFSSLYQVANIDRYDNDHIAEIMQTSGIHTAFRYIDTNKDALKPYLAFYPMPDIAFTQGEEFRKISVHSKLLPGTGLCYDLADIDVRYYGLTENGERKGGPKQDPAPCLVTVAIEPDAGSGLTNDLIDEWYRTTQAERISQIPGYQRTTRYKLLYARTNAQSRALKGLPTTNEPAPEPPTWQAIHEFDRVVQPEELQPLKGAEKTKELLSKTKETEFNIFRLAKAFGEKRFFD
ncbi:hypothetical protein NA57DRAFT_74778 [Rhizodiscina lignyota]|uniref:Uncharacterized protein n=1 Tax=Rhizodiscina lignyota TaxID=1504668 RepID=A0A9P4ICC9_9PEZI|nr:hypothetical protein NA57DRAFT_74778 [Rhizodiscina lignyota]